MSDYGYRVPDGDADISEMACQLVFYPDIPEYRTVLFTALERFAVWTSWERESDHKGKDAAESWKAANELTWECWRMACLEQLQSDVSAILAFLQQSVPCCGDNITYGDSTTYTTIIIPGDGTAPATYGETEVSDWDEWTEYLCHNANLWVDELIRAALTIGVALDTGGISIAFVASVLTAVAFIVVGGVLTLPFLAVIVAGLAANVSATIFEDAAVDLEDARYDIVCAITSGQDVATVVELALSSGTAWDLLFSQIDYDSAMAILYEGGDGDAQFLEAEADTSCGCDCLQLRSFEPTINTINYATEAGAQWVMPRRTASGYNNHIEGNFSVNYDLTLGYCGNMKVIDTISVSDGLDFQRLQLKNQANTITYDSYYNTVSCTEDIGDLVGKTFARLYLSRKSPGDGGCGAGSITITVTWHDA